MVAERKRRPSKKIYRAAKQLTEGTKTAFVRLPTCAVTGKVKYATEASALVSLDKRQSERSNNKERKEARVYACRRCGGWHLTSQSQRTRPD